jgi:hypothetical protein
MEYSFIAHVEDGRLKIGLRAIELMRHALASWRRCDVVVTIEKRHATRSLDQNALYWAGYVGPIADYTGNSPDWIHAYLKQRFLPKQRIEIVDKRTGVIVDDVDLAQLTTTRLNKIEFGDYLRAIEEWVIDEFHGSVRVGSNREDAA